MTRFVDGRIPVVVDGDTGPGDYVMRLAAGPATVHSLDCACCAARSPAAWALDRLFLDRVRGAVPWFNRVVVLGDGDAVRRALAEDGIVSTRFRLAAD